MTPKTQGSTSRGRPYHARNVQPAAANRYRDVLPWLLEVIR